MPASSAPQWLCLLARISSYPWDQVRKIGEGSFQVMLDEDNIDDYSVFGGVEGEPAAGWNWRVSKLINSYAYVGGDIRYG